MSNTLILDGEYRENVLRFLASNYMGQPGQYRYSAACAVPTLYSSTLYLQLPETQPSSPWGH